MSDGSKPRSTTRRGFLKAAAAVPLVAGVSPGKAPHFNEGIEAAAGRLVGTSAAVTPALPLAVEVATEKPMKGFSFGYRLWDAAEELLEKKRSLAAKNEVLGLNPHLRKRFECLADTSWRWQDTANAQGYVFRDCFVCGEYDFSENVLYRETIYESICDDCWPNMREILLRLVLGTNKEEPVASPSVE